MIAELRELDPLAGELQARARRHGVQLIWRAQGRIARRVIVRDSKPEQVSRSTLSGHGLHVVTDSGHSVLASRDDFRPEAALELLDRTVDTAASGARLGLDAGHWPKLDPCRQTVIPEAAETHLDVDLTRVEKRLVELESEFAGRCPGVSLRLSFASQLDVWRITRTDGTDTLFAMPRCSLVMLATSTNNSARHAVSASVFHPSADALEHDRVVRLFLRRGEAAARLACALPDAPNYPAGSTPIVIDYALAKGLAHEAFGHASEADGFRSSVLAQRGQFRVGERVGPDHVSIIDEPVKDDHAWQPISANGIPRQRATLVDHGYLKDALSDPWSADPGGVPLTATARAESFRHAPQPRMTNIRIEVDDPLPAAGVFEDYGPDEVRDLLTGAGVFRRHPKVAFLSGYRGGQVNTASGDFVFNCKAIYELSATGCKMYKPAIFSGSMFGALESIREAFGPLCLDATGYCGKWGQSVPSSGGSHFFMVLDAHPSVRLGGR